MKRKSVGQTVAAGGEGLILRADRPYDHCHGSKKTKHSVKVKPNYESEGTIIKLLRTPKGKPSYRINNLTGDLYNGCDPEKEIRVTHGAPTGLSVGAVITFTYLDVSKNMNATRKYFF